MIRANLLQGIVVLSAALMLPVSARAGDSFEKKLRTFKVASKPVLATPAPETPDAKARLHAAMLKLGEPFSDEELPQLEAYVLKPDTEPGEGWVLVPTFVERGRFIPVARFATRALAASTQAGYEMSRWWETLFGARKDYAQLSDQLGLAFAAQYEKSDEPTRRVIAAIFNREPSTPKEFRKFIESRASHPPEEVGPEKKEKPKTP